MIHISVTCDVVKRCPFKDEIDFGNVILTFKETAPELHYVADLIATYRDRQLSHEDFTNEMLAVLNPETVVSTWTTAGFSVTVTGSL